MKKIIIITILLLTGLSSNAQDRQELVISITGEDIAFVVDQFNRSQSDFHVVVQNQEYRNWRYAINQFRFSQENQAKGTTDRVVDIAFIDNNWLPGMIEARWLEDITGKITNEKRVVKGLTQAATKDGRLYALPFSTKGQVLYYRRDLHEKYGLPAPRTLKILEQNARLLMEHKEIDHGITLHYSAIHLDVLPFLWSNGGGIIKNGKVIVNHQRNIDVLTYLQKLSRSGVLPGPDTFAQLKGSYSHAKKLFMEGKSAYIITWNNRISDFENSSLAGNFGVLPIPPLKEGQESFSVIGSWYFVINSFSQHKERAVRFLNYFFNDENQLELALKSNAFIPAIESLYTNTQLTSKNPYLLDLRSAMSNIKHRLKHPDEPRISQILENSIKEILIEEKPVKNILDIAQKRIASIYSTSDN